MRQLPLSVRASTVLDGSGNGIAQAGPLSPGETWSGLTVSVRVATQAAEATCSIYAGADATAAYFADATTWGSTGDSTQNLGTVRVGQNVSAAWSGGDPGAQATMTITGTRQVA